MRAVDTNILLRLILADDARQLATASAIARDPIFVADTVFVETARVLEFSYRLDRPRLAAALSGLLDLPTVVVEYEAGLRWAIDQMRDGGADLADMVHLVTNRRAGTFATFDTKLARQAGPDTPVIVETLTA